MTLVLDYSMTPDEVLLKIQQFNNQNDPKKREELEQLREKRMKSFGKAFLDVEDPVALQREWRDD